MSVIIQVHFSDHFGISETTLTALGVLDPIMNYDTKVFAALLLLLRNSRDIGDKCWRAAQKKVHIP